MFRSWRFRWDKLNSGAENEMDLEYFQGTDTLIIGFSDRETVESRDVGAGCQIELDADGKIVSISDEHAGEHIDILRLSY